MPLKNQRINEIYDEYATRMFELENIYYDFYGFAPTYEDAVFWEDNEVKRINCLLRLWWDIREIRELKQ